MSQIDPLMVKIQTQLLRATFLKNMAVLKEQMPAIYNYYQNYSASKIQLALDDNGQVNLVSNGEFVYQGDAKESSKIQVKEFLKAPPCFNFDVNISTTHYYEHEKVIHEIFDKRRSELGANSCHQLQKNGEINFIAIMGSGLGYHLENLFNDFSIRSAFIFEPEPDCFFATLHCVDIGEMLKHCISLGGELTFKIGGTKEEYVNEINSRFKKVGYFNVSKMYLYRHYLSDKTTDAFKMINEMAYRYRSGWGFCEDEVIGISHTLTNISKNKAPILLVDAKKKNRDLPVFIIGNGPSLDESLAYLKANQDNAIIISSGTSLKPLLNNGIIPDFHVEQERPASIYQWVKKIGYEETLKQIDLICLNTVYPKILALFKKAHIVLKSGDAGTTFIHDSISDKYEELFFCNPTVTNASTAVAVAMGFKNLTLFGLDYGFKSEQDHHAQGSIYDDIKNYKLCGDFQVEGNFSNNVFTTRIFDSSRGVLEMLLEKNQDVKCTNCSDGAKIALTQGVRVKHLPELKKIKNKATVVSCILDDSFDNRYYQQIDIMSDFHTLQPSFAEYTKQLISFTENVKSRLELVNAFSQQYQFVYDIKKDSTKKLFHRFMNGSLNYLQSTIVSNVYRYSERVQQEAYIQYCLKTMNQHLNWLVNDLGENYNKPAKR